MDFSSASITGVFGNALIFAGVAIGALNAGPNVLSYNGTQAGLQGPPGTPVAPFTNFPIT